MKSHFFLILLSLSLFFWSPVLAEPSFVSDGWVTVKPPEFTDAINNPVKGFRDYKEGGYGLLVRSYIDWNDIEVGADDSVDRIIAHTNKIAKVNGKNFEDLNVKLVPRVYLDWDGSAGKQHWPTDLHTFDYDSPQFHKRLRALIAKLGQAWDNDPRIFAVQMGFIGYWGEHHTPAPTSYQLKLLAEEFKKAFRNKPVLVRHTDPEFIEAGFGLYYDTYGFIGREPLHGTEDQFPTQVTHFYPNVWKNAPLEGEVEYNWQNERESAKPEETFGRTENETMTVPKYRNYMIDKIRRYHTSYLGWIDNYDAKKPDVLAGAAELQKAFGYRFILEEISYPISLKPGDLLPVKLKVKNTGSAPFYLDWPVAVALLDPKTAEPVWSAPLSGVDIRKWLPGEAWDSEAFTYKKPAFSYQESGTAKLPINFKQGNYIVAVSILDRQGGLLPSVRFATSNYFQGGWHPLGLIGVGVVPEKVALTNATFDSPAFDKSLHYVVPAKLKSVVAPPIPVVKAVTPWASDPKVQLINPARYWVFKSGSEKVEKQILNESGRVMRVVGDFGKNTTLEYDFGKKSNLEKGRYRFSFRIRGTPDLTVKLELGDDWETVATLGQVSLKKTWEQQTIDFDVNHEFKSSSTIRFRLPNEKLGEFDLASPQMKKID